MGCSDCAYWEPIDDDAGQCRRNAPRPRAVDTGWRWPITNDDDWCGEWEADEPTCDCDDDEACPVCEPDAVHVDIDEAFHDIVDRLEEQPRHRWWRRK